jgi:hypothetical protein
MHSDTVAGLKQGLLIGMALLVLVLPSKGPGPQDTTAAAALVATPRTPVPRTADFDGQAASSDARRLADWVARSHDHGGSPFALLDKRDARLLVFDGEARLIGATPVLLGAAPGDHSVTGIGMRPIAEIRPEERTTPAGRFRSQPGRNATGEDVVWVDYEAAVSMHRLRAVDPSERRLERLESPTPDDNRISYGCINVPPAFYDAVVSPVLGRAPAWVYVLPETLPMDDVFAGVAPAMFRTDPSAAR